MKVLMTADAVGGVWTYALELARTLAPHGVTIDLATMGPLPSPAQAAEAALVPGLTLLPSSFALEWMPEPWEQVRRAGDWLLGLERTRRPDLVHLNGYAHGALDWSVPVLVAGHSCVLSWWQAVKGEDAPPEWDRYRDVVRAGVQAAHLVIAPTEAMRQALQAYYGPLPPSRVVPNGRAGNAFQPRAKEPFVFTAGRVWDEAKNIGALAAAAPHLPWPVVVAGKESGPNAGNGERAETCGLHTLGLLRPEQVAGFLARAAIYALPARYEPFGLSALEAGLSGCALVLGDIPSLREVWGDAARFVPPGDPEALRAALCRLISDSANRELGGERARTRARTYTGERMAACTLAAYRALREMPVCA